MPPFTDLRALANSLSGDDRFSGLAATIKKAARAQSCATDLKQAQSCIDALAKLGQTSRGYKTHERSATESALLMHGIQLYVRATELETKRADRGSVPIKTKFSAAQMADHDVLVALRNRVGAHVYVGEHVQGEVWNDDLLFAIKTPEGWLPANASNVVQYDGAAFQRLSRQVPVALALMIARFQDLFTVMTAKLNAGSLSETCYLEHQFNPVGVLGTERDVRALIADGPGASRTVLTVTPHRGVNGKGPSR